MSDFWSEKLITDYLDDRLSPAERQQVDAHLKSNTGDAEKLNEFQELRSLLRGARKYELDGGFSDRVIQAIGTAQSTSRNAKSNSAVAAITAMEEPAIEKAKSPISRKPSQQSGGFNWRTAAIGLATLAATAMLAIFIIDRPSSRDEMARNTNAELSANSAAESDRQDHAGAAASPTDEMTPAEPASETAAPASIPGKSGKLPGPEMEKKQSQGSRFAEQRQRKSPGQGADTGKQTEKDQAFRTSEPSDAMAKNESDDGIFEKGDVMDSDLADSKSKEIQSRSPANALNSMDDSPMKDSELLADSLNESFEEAPEEAPEKASRFQTSELVVLNVPTTSSNLSVIGSFERGSDSREAVPLDSGALSKKDDSANDLSRSHALKKQLQSKSNDDFGGGLAGGGLGDAVIGGNTERVARDRILEGAYVYEISATPEEFAQVIQQLEGNKMGMDDSGKFGMLERMNELKFDSADSKDEKEDEIDADESGRAGAGRRGRFAQNRRDQNTATPFVGPTIRRLEPGVRNEARPYVLKGMTDQINSEAGIDNLKSAQTAQSGEPAAGSRAEGIADGNATDPQPVERKSYVLIIQMGTGAELATPQPMTEAESGADK